jgi:hypothetical protein
VVVAPAGLLTLGVSGTVCPTATDAVAGASWKLVIAAGNACTVSAADTVAPLLSVAVIVTAPAETPVATHEEPLTLAVAMAELELAQLASVGVGEPPEINTEYVTAPPTFTVADGGVMFTTSGGGGVVTKPSPPPPPQAAASSATPASAIARGPRALARRPLTVPVPD